MSDPSQFFEKVATYTPLSGGRFRCNQNGTILKKGQTKKNRRTLIKTHLNSLSFPDPVISALKTKRSHLEELQQKVLTLRNWDFPTVTIDREGDARCPFCLKWNNQIRRNGVTKCLHCSKLFVVEGSIFKTLLDPDGYACCPHCKRWNPDADLGINTCGHCQKKYEALF
jgi:hypothetical protein